jgi:uncharacterized membrane protein YphA (DoxX/SURF4 family)
MNVSEPSPTTPQAATLALTLRIGLGLVFVIGGWNKLAQLIDPTREAGLVGTYMGPLGYINGFFAEFLFTGPLGQLLTPFGFLTMLSTFELASGLALMAGLLVRPLALLYGFFLWSFVFALPVTTSPGVEPAFATIGAPAMLVQARDIALSGMMFTLFNLGAGAPAIDHWLFGDEATEASADWDSLGLLLRLALALPLLVGGAFAGMDHIQSFATPAVILIAIGVALAVGLGSRLAGAALVLTMLLFIGHKIDPAGTLIANLNGFKRELALLAGAGVIAWSGGGNRFTLADLAIRLELANCLIQLKHLGRRCTPRLGWRGR